MAPIERLAEDVRRLAAECGCTVKLSIIKDANGAPHLRTKVETYGPVREEFNRRLAQMVRSRGLYANGRTCQ